MRLPTFLLCAVFGSSVVASVVVGYVLLSHLDLDLSLSNLEDIRCYRSAPSGPQRDCVASSQEENFSERGIHGFANMKGRPSGLNRVAGLAV